MSESKNKKIGGFDVELYRNNATFVVGERQDVRFAMSSDGAKFIEPEDYEGDEVYGGFAIVEDKAQQDGIRKIMDYMIKEHLDGEITDDVNYIAIKNGDDCVYSQGDHAGEIYEGFEGNLALKLKKKRFRKDGKENPAPEVYGQDGELITSLPDKRVLHDGSYGRVQVRVYTYEYRGKKSIGLDFDAILYTKEGERILPKGGGKRVNKSALMSGYDPQEVEDVRNSVFGNNK